MSQQLAHNGTVLPSGQVPPAQRLRQAKAAQAIAAGTIKVPLRCGHCRSESVTEDRGPDARQNEDASPADYECLSCGRRTSIKTAHRLRRQELRAVILKGVDLV